MGELFKPFAASWIQIFKRLQIDLAGKNLKFFAIIKAPFFKLIEKSNGFTDLN